MIVQQWSPGMVVGEGMRLYLVLLTGTNLQSFYTPDQRGPKSLGLWVAESRQAAATEAALYFGWDGTINEPVPVALDVGEMIPT